MRAVQRPQIQHESQFKLCLYVLAEEEGIFNDATIFRLALCDRAPRFVFRDVFGRILVAISRSYPCAFIRIYNFPWVRRDCLYRRRDEPFLLRRQFNSLFYRHEVGKPSASQTAKGPTKRNLIFQPVRNMEYCIVSPIRHRQLYLLCRRDQQGAFVEVRDFNLYRYLSVVLYYGDFRQLLQRRL